MVVQLTSAELDRRLTHLDAELIALGLHLKFRAMRCFLSLYGSVPDGDCRHQLFDPITSWFVKRYGELAHWDGVIGRIPILLRNVLYLVRVPFVAEDAVINFTDRFEGLSPEIASSFTLEEFKSLGHKILGGTSSFFKLYTLSVDDPFLDDTERDLIWMGMFDLETSASCLKVNGDTRNSIFHSHAAAEKFLKVGLMRSGYSKNLKSLGHNLPELFRRLVKAEARYAWLQSSVDLLQASAPSMEIRYRMLPRTTQDAISTFNAALALCGTLAEIWMFDVERGTKQSSFRPDCFYLDWGKRTFYCKEIIDNAGKERLAVLIQFRIDSITGHGLVMEMKKAFSHSATFLEVIDKEQIQALRTRYDFQMKNRGKQVTPEDMGIQIASGPEGSYITGNFAVKASKSNF